MVSTRPGSADAPTTAPDPLLSITQDAEYLNVSRGFVQNAIYKHNTLPGYKIGRNVLRVRKSDVDALLTPVNR